MKYNDDKLYPKSELLKILAKEQEIVADRYFKMLELLNSKAPDEISGRFLNGEVYGRLGEGDINQRRKVEKTVEMMIEHMEIYNR